MGEGRKFDGDKLRYDLLPFDVIDELVKDLTYGAKKYEENNWQKVDAKRYRAALMRHFSAYMQGEEIDKESGLPHIVMVMCNAMFLRWKDKHQLKDTIEKITGLKAAKVSAVEKMADKIIELNINPPLILTKKRKKKHAGKRRNHSVRRNRKGQKVRAYGLGNTVFAEHS